METLNEGGIFMDENASNVENSILASIKHKLGIVKEYTVFDPDIIDFINSTFLELSQLGLKSNEDYFITSDSEMWTDFIPESNLLHYVKTYIYLSVKLLFDPPASSVAVESINKLISKYEWRIEIEVEKMNKEGSQDE